MLFHRCAIDDIKSLKKVVEELGNFFRWILQIIVDRDGSLATLRLRPLDLQAMLDRFLDRTLDPQRLVHRIEIGPCKANISDRLAPVNAAVATIGNNAEPLKPPISTANWLASTTMP